MMDMFRHELADVTLISVGHRPELEEYHDRRLMLLPHLTGVAVAPDEDAARRRRWVSLLRRALRGSPTPDASVPVSSA
jgi:putative ATP-binding cassette transporter